MQDTFGNFDDGGEVADELRMETHRLGLLAERMHDVGFEDSDTVER